jgi:hypothetical protein
VLKYSADVSKVCKLLGVVFIVLSVDGTRRLIYSISFPLFRHNLEHYVSCNTAAVD